MSVFVLVGAIGSNQVLATVKIPEVDLMTRILQDNILSNEVTRRSPQQTSKIPNSLIPNDSASYPDNLVTAQTVGQIKLKFHLLEKINSLLLVEFPMATTEIATTNIEQAKPPLESTSSLTKNNNSPRYPKIARSSLIVNLPENKAFSTQLSLVNPAPEMKNITSGFGWRIRPYSGQRQFHKGIDYGAPLGSPVVAAGNGIVTKVVSGCADFRNLSCGQQFGNRIEIDHGNGAIATYGHLLHNSIKITEGTKVWQNQEIAQVGSSGWSSGAHLDFRIEVNGEFQDPNKYVK
ncbi:M23 family metallopeptidase [Xenococcus sp. PCC 7305]|uniref:M23 family metallopeptidase n=1 Tax=Xenococcus sp. PCC 7305 TaxID=102125 RepID=UPI0002FBBB7F|nr:M23 family metallopeptidase [Xenococcus sp. PCC 7305]